MSEYCAVQKGGLKLKGVSDHKIKKHKKQKSDKKPMKCEEQEILVSSRSNNEGKAKFEVDRRTAAEIAFARAKEKRAVEEIAIKASKTHKERIMEFNERLDNLTEHFDIPKVSWTK